MILKQTIITIVHSQQHYDDLMYGYIIHTCVHDVLDVCHVPFETEPTIDRS